MSPRIAAANNVRAAVALLAVGLAAIGSPGVANATNDAAGSPGVPNASSEAGGSPSLPSGSNGGFGKPGVASASDDDSDDNSLHPKCYRYADAVGSELTPGLPQAEPSVLGTAVPVCTDGSVAGLAGAGGAGGMPAPSTPIVMPVGQTAAPQGGQSRGPAVPASPIVSVTPQSAQ
jgi:hypothetical protein